MLSGSTGREVCLEPDGFPQILLNSDHHYEFRLGPKGLMFPGAYRNEVLFKWKDPSVLSNTMPLGRIMKESLRFPYAPFY
jgi:hypothetical protein